MKKTQTTATSTPWLKDLAQADSRLLLKVKNEIEKNFQKRFRAFFVIANNLKIAEDESVPVKEVADLPGIQGNNEILLAILFQNLIQPKNNLRKDAVANKTYQEITSQEDSRTFLTSNLTYNLTNRVQARTKEIAADAQKSLSKRGFNLFFLAPDFHFAAAILVASKFTLAERDNLFNELIEKNETVPGFKDKLRALNIDFYHNHRVFKDGFLPGQEKDRIEHTRKVHYKVWLECVRRLRVLTNAEFISIFPEAAYKADLWNETIDQNGQPKLNQKKYWEYVNNWKANKRQEKLKRKAEEAKKKKF